MAGAALRLHLELHLRHVDAGRALAAAAFAADAEVERVTHRVAGQGFDAGAGIELTRERETQRVGAAARQVLLVARRAVARAHRAGVELAAVAVVVAHLDRLGEAAAGVAAAARRADGLGAWVVLHVPRRPVEDRLQRRGTGSPAGNGRARASSIRGGSTILPGFIRFAGSRCCLIARNASSMRGPNCRAIHSPRHRPSPCSPL